MNLLSMFSDDQLAVFGCFLAIAVCGLVATLSYRLGPAGQKKSQTFTMPMNAARPAPTTTVQDRRAA